MSFHEPPCTTRRSFLSYLGALSLGAAAPLRAIPPPSSASDDVLDEALERLAPYGPSFRGGLSNHGPMAAEALVALGQTDAVLPWVERYRRRLEPRAKVTTPIPSNDWQSALGKATRTRDWEQWFTVQLAEAPWKEVVGRWVPRLAPGIAAAGLHGVIRVGHAVTALVAKETPLRIDELARALGYWAAEYLELPGRPDGTGTLPPSAALASVPLLPEEERTGRGLITTELNDLVGFEPFLAVIDLVDPGAGTPGFMSELLCASAGMFVNARSNSFEFLHAITGAAAVVELLPFVPEKERPTVRAYVWQANAAMFARFGTPELLDDIPVDSKARFDALAKHAAESGDAHTIKLTAACMREWKRHADPRMLAAADARNR